MNLREQRNVFNRRRDLKKSVVAPPRNQQMATDQNWGSVWPGPKTFHPATVPLPIRQGFTPKGVPAPGKFANAELMKIPNFLHLTPPIIQRQCEALKKFCTEWPKELNNEEQIRKHFPVEVISSTYCHGLPTIRNPLSRIVTVKLPLSTLKLDKHARDKFLRLVGERYCSETDILTIVTDRCPLQQQNHDYAHYLITALYHESWTTEPWEATKTEADMEVYIWSRNKSKETSESILNWGMDVKTATARESYGIAVETLINDGENEYNLKKYKEEVVSMLNLKTTSL